jgi:hypothetical protein
VRPHLFGYLSYPVRMPQYQSTNIQTNSESHGPTKTCTTIRYPDVTNPYLVLVLVHPLSLASSPTCNQHHRHPINRKERHACVQQFIQANERLPACLPPCFTHRTYRVHWLVVLKPPAGSEMIKKKLLRLASPMRRPSYLPCLTYPPSPHAMPCRYCIQHSTRKQFIQLIGS